MVDVVVTGLGIVSGIGSTIPETLASLRAGQSGVAPVSLFETRHHVPVAEVKRSNAELIELLGVDAKQPFTRTALLGMLAAKEALDDAGLTDKRSKLRIGLVSSTSVGGMDKSERFFVDYKDDNSKGRLRDIVGHDCADSTEHIARYLGITDFVTTISTACSSAANAIMLGARMIKAGMLDCVVVGGADSLCRFTLNGFSSLLILDKNFCRPFDATRKGLNLGEGAGFLVLQKREDVLRTPYCRLAGYANVNDAYHQTASSPEGTGPYLAMSKALEVAGLDTGDIDYINVHGTGTENNDMSEGKAMRRLFGDTVPPFSSTKPFTGHTLGAAGGIEAVLSVLAIEHGLVYPNLHFVNPIEELGLYPVTSLRTSQNIKNVMSNSFGFGGNSSSLIFSKEQL